MKKTVLFFVWIITGLFMMLTIPDGVTAAETEDIDDWEYEQREEGMYITSYNGSDNIITIPCSMEGINVTGIGDYAFFDCSGAKEIIIPDTVTKIGENAFFGCSSLEKINLPAELTELGSWAFGACSKLNNISIPNKITTIDEYTFAECTSLEKVNFSAALTTIGELAFGGCSSLTDIEIPGSVQVVGTQAFFNCKSLKSVTLPASVTSIGSNAFGFCNNGKWETVAQTDFTIYGKTKSTADKYATENGFTFYDRDVKYVILSTRSFSYDGKAKKPRVTVKDYMKNVLKENRDYTITYKNNVNPGTATVEVKFKGKYKGTTKTTFNIVLPATKINSVVNTTKGVKVSWSKVPGTGYYVYRKTGNGSYKLIKTITGASCVSYTDAGAKTNGTTYRYCIVAFKKTGNTTQKSSNSAGKSTVYLTQPSIKKATNTKGKKVTLQWNKNSKAGGYQIKYVTGSKSKTIKITKNTTLNKVISGLSGKAKYNFYVRSYKTVGKTTYYSAWSPVKTVKINK